METCRICSNKEGNKLFTTKEMLYGTKDKFDYIECSKCKCVQIKHIPDNIGAYYPDDYGSFVNYKKVKDTGIIAFIRRKKLEHNLGIKKSLIGYFSTLTFGEGFEQKLIPAKLSLDSSILDVGTGTGGRILNMRRRGFKNLTGTDLFIKEDIFYSNGVNIYKKDITEIDEQYDFIMLNHSFEHMPDPLSVMKELYRLLKPNKTLLIRIPVADSFAWRNYGTNWVALDPPRHFYLHTPDSIKILAEKTGFELKEVIYDSSEFQFIGSEQYIKDIPLRSKTSFYQNPDMSIFTKKQIKEYHKKALKLNKAQDGDAACFYLYKS
ncbi:MAG: class I SAM-dependent methyltransferase [Bacteroidales bacterium]|nr:class I SAM-dependent methyltransferase [Bacteroidales bacterium]MDT8432410.1 class I SAM-dependent methyltransferase [Bacteroidales bacterium]